MSVALYRAYLADGTTRRVRVDALPHALIVEGDRHPAHMSPAAAVEAYGRSRGWDVVAVAPPPGAQ